MCEAGGEEVKCNNGYDSPLFERFEVTMLSVSFKEIQSFDNFK